MTLPKSVEINKSVNKLRQLFLKISAKCFKSSEDAPFRITLKNSQIRWKRISRGREARSSSYKLKMCIEKSILINNNCYHHVLSDVKTTIETLLFLWPRYEHVFITDAETLLKRGTLAETSFYTRITTYSCGWDGCGHDNQLRSTQLSLFSAKKTKKVEDGEKKCS